jgi:hypothetical protein
MKATTREILRHARRRRAMGLDIETRQRLARYLWRIRREYLKRVRADLG